MGEMSVAWSGQQLRTLLGSCIGLALHDEQHKIGGLAHIVLPEAPGETDRPGKFVDTAIPALVERMRKAAGGELQLIAKIAGGASMFNASEVTKIGLQNTVSCERHLGDLGIPIVGRHCGGKQGRRMLFCSVTGRVVIEIAGRPPIEL